MMNAEAANKWKFLPFGKLFQWCAKSAIKSGDGQQEGAYTLFVCSDTEVKRTDNFLESGESLIFGTGGKASCHYTNEPFSYSTDCVVAQKRMASICTKFYYYYLRRNQLSELQSTFSGIGLQHTSKKKIERILIPVPTLSEQERIVSKIEELFSQLDSGVETLKKAKQQLAVYRQAVLKEAFQGYPQQIQLNKISHVITGYAFKSKMYSEYGQYVVVKIGNVKPFRFDFSRDFTHTMEDSEEILRRYLLKDGDCLITLTGTRGKRDYGFVVMVDGQTNLLLNQRVAALRFNQSLAFPKFFQYYLSSPLFRNSFFSYETGNVGQGNVGIKALSEPMVVCPPIEKQREITKQIESRLSVCDSIEQTIDAVLQQAEALRQSVLKKAFAGELC